MFLKYIYGFTPTVSERDCWDVELITLKVIEITKVAHVFKGKYLLN